MPASSASRVLVADDEELILRLFQSILSPDGIEVTGVQSGHEALEKLRSQTFELVYTDLRMPDGDGIDVLRWCRENCPEVPVIMVTGHATVDSAIEAMKLGAFEYIQKPFNTTELQYLTKTALETVRLRRQNMAFRRQIASEYDFSGIVGQTRGMRTLLDRAKSAASSHLPVLALGESGTGKTSLASAIHYNSDRGNDALIVVDCTAMSEESTNQFFGVGTGTNGVLDASASTSVLFEDVGNLPVAGQQLLGQWLERTKDLRASSARILATSNTDLRAAVDSGDFREGLFYSLAAVQLEIPPLRARRDDIPRIVEVLLERIALSEQSPRKHADREALDLLKVYRWPGNIRELISVLQQAFVASGETTIEAGNLTLPGIGEAATTPNAIYLPGGDLTLKEIVADVIEQVERLKILEALELTGGNRTKAALLIGTSLRNFMYKMKELDIG